jgi:hypothetical protein
VQLDPNKNVVLTPAQASRVWNRQKVHTPPLLAVPSPERTPRPDFYDWRAVRVAKKALWWARRNDNLLPTVILSMEEAADVLWSWGVRWQRESHPKYPGYFCVKLLDRADVKTDGVQECDEPDWGTAFRVE